MNSKLKIFVLTVIMTVLFSSAVFASTVLPVTFDTELEKHIFKEMIQNKNEIDISEFNINDNFPGIVRKMRVQNPLLPKVTKAGYNKNLLILEYDKDSENNRKRQEKVLGTALDIVNKNIDKDMDNLTRQKVLYDYLQENSTYDEVAANALPKGATVVPEEHRDSFSAYGVLVNKKGVCGGYAEAYKILLNLAGIESIIVTGYLDNGTYHSWNKVKHGDNWYNVDVTNNYNVTGIPYLLYNTTDETAKSLGYKIDNKYWTEFDSHIFNSTDKRLDSYVVENNIINNLEDLKSKILKSLANSNHEDFYRFEKEIPREEVKSMSLRTLEYNKSTGTHRVGLRGKFLLVQTIE